MPLLCLIVRVRFSSSFTSLSYVGQLLRQAIPNNQSTQDNIFSLKKQQKSAEKPKMWCGKKKRALCQGEKLVEIQTRKDVGWGLLEKIRTFCVSWLFLCFAQSSSQSPKMSTIIERVQNWLFSVCRPSQQVLTCMGNFSLQHFFNRFTQETGNPHTVNADSLRFCVKIVVQQKCIGIELLELAEAQIRKTHTHQCTTFHMSRQPGQCES